MEQYIKKSAVVAEIERLRKSNKPKEDKDYAQFELDVSCGYNMALDDIKTFIDSLQEEPVNEDLEKAVYNFVKSYIKGGTKQSWLREGYIAGVKWQKEHGKFAS